MTSHFENQYSAWSDSYTRSRAALRNPNLTFSDRLKHRTEANTARSMINRLDRIEHQEDWDEIRVCTQAGTISRTHSRFAGNVKAFEDLAVSFANHFGNEGDFEGFGGRKTKPEWIAFHEYKAGIEIGPDVWVEVNGKEVHRVKVIKRGKSDKKKNNA